MAKQVTKLRQLEKTKALRLERAQRVAWRRQHPSYLHSAYLPQRAWPAALITVSALHIVMACAVVVSALMAGEQSPVRLLYGLLCGVLGVGLFFHAQAVRSFALALAVFQTMAIYAVVAYGVSTGTPLVSAGNGALSAGGLLDWFSAIGALSTTANTLLVLAFAMLSVFALTRDSLKSCFGIPSWM